MSSDPPEDSQASPPLAGEEVSAGIEAETEKTLRRENRRVLLLVCVVAAFMLLAHFTPLGAWITEVREWKEMLRAMGLKGEGVFAVACAAGVMLGLPRLPLCAAAGLLFGFGEGLLASLSGAVTGSYGAFLLARA
ncbi:MAG TPA: hypothetical protein PLP58_19005, partial [Prosthecobacter sp.]|nr:hypothetical protein [Prosthecobacter sp.]